MEWVYLAKQNRSPGNLAGAKQSPFGERCQAQSREDRMIERMTTGQLLITKKRYSIVKNKSKDLRKNISQKIKGLIQCNPNTPGLHN